MTDVSKKLSGITVAIPESRQLDTMVQLLERRGGTVRRVPMVAIHDAPDPEPVLAWIRQFISATPDLFIILTGEGVKRLIALADRHGLKDELVSAFTRTELLCRGPKPDRVLREIGLKGDIPAIAPTTDGIIETLKSLPVEEKLVAVQLYGDDPNEKLMVYLSSRHARTAVVAPYIYADKAEESQVINLIHELSAKKINCIAFTSQPQYKRLAQVARTNGLESELQKGLSQCCVAAVGPLVRDQLEEAGVKVDIMPGQAFFMKPLVTEIMRFFTP